ncbi:MAG TPA: YihY/virulence factor BrkB family protein, partial [Candidatus Binatia bacterium]|nr:YihY/virulence factor BrkB family protein [Candidatus Binatia bacterium]
MRRAWQLLSETFNEWSEDRAPRLGAALAYYALFSLAPVLVIAIGLAGLVFDRRTVERHVLDQVTGLVGAQGAEAVRAMLESAIADPAGGLVAVAVGLVALVLGATGAFAELQDALNTIWNVKARPAGGLLGMVRARALSFAMVLVIAFLLLVALVVSAALAALGPLLGAVVPPGVLHAVNTVVSLAVITGLFAMIFKVLPDAEVAWRDVWLGAALTALLFVVGKEAIGLYLGKAGVASGYGAAGSLVVVLVWVYYAAQILFFGAELTQVYARRRRPVVPAAGAEVRQSPLPAEVDAASRRPGWTLAALAAMAGFLLGRTPLRRLVARTPEA